MLTSWLDLIVLSAIFIAIYWLVSWRRMGSRISYETVLVAATISPFVAAFASKLGERLGTRVRIKRLSWRQRRRRGEELVVAQPFRHRAITIEVRAELSDEARLALIDLDVGQEVLWGHLLRWDDEAKAWLPVPIVSNGDDAA
ncbi:hypothetical protein [Streptomyces sp. NPDC098781]|uniref:hypothetical protein n=1 Tax=Streptomyces sp. NPDC098781 TaxID=3366097 RepID=UPI003818D9B0